ncbi:HAD-IA family hydrolase [Paenibacillus graminis]|uniref:HAD-IA family hydrolase n=1 Tax=Paenibacillus graminis TaxID=189425 RepID=UPI002DB8D696|nr:HAD-IA family hydrolase [Paenibacillus graminis]MEC0167257.1 HAD-IA family hydrolase [Paenibacillus graminis]
MVDAGRIRRGKPAPETFTNAADYLKVPYASCIGVEDAAAGVEAIKRAGMFAVGIGSAQTLRQADYLVADTEQLSAEHILAAYSRWIDKA